VLYFSAKWILTALGTLGLLLFFQLLLKLLCCARSVCHNTIGAYPVLFLLGIMVSYFFSLYYGVLLLRALFSPSDDEQRPYPFADPFELHLLKAFVFNEVIVGAILILQLVTVLMCGALTKSAHLNEIEGEGFGVDEAEVRRIKAELEESRIKTEQIRKVQGWKSEGISSDIDTIKREARASDLEMM